MNRYLKDVREACPHCEAAPGSACEDLGVGVVHLARRVLSLAREKPDAMPAVKKALEEP